MEPTDYKLANRSDSIIATLLANLVAEKGSNVSFVQVGGNDGILADPLSPTARKMHWRGIIIEPVPAYFDKLKRTYADQSHVDCINIAIGEPGEQAIYFATSEALERERVHTGEVFAQGVASFSRQHLLDYGLAESDISSTIVPVATLASVLAQENTTIDLMVIDVEGAELNVLKSMDWARSVDTIVFESDHMSQADQATLSDLLAGAGYEVFWKWPDSFAVKKSNQAVIQLFAQLERLKYSYFAERTAAIKGQRNFPIKKNSPTSEILDAGWSPPEDHGAWNTSEIVTLMVPVSPALAHCSAIELSVLGYTPFVDQMISISSQDIELGTYLIPRQNSHISHSVCVLPITNKDVIKFEFIELRIWIRNTVRPWKHGLGEDRRPLGLALAQVTLLD